MSSCTDPKLREKLFAYELAMLDDLERQELELHLYECDACYNDLHQLADWAEHLREAHAIREAVIAEGEPFQEKGRKKHFTRLLIAVAAILILAFPAYRYWLHQPDIVVTQRIELVPSRAARGGVVDLGLGGDVEIAFVAEGVSPGISYHLTIASRSGTVIHEEDFSVFSESGQGSVTLPTARFEPGFYRLTLTDPTATPPASIVAYSFRAE